MKLCFLNGSRTSVRHRLPGIAAAFAVLISVSTTANAATISATCETADSISGTSGPLIITYEGEQSGTLTVKSTTIDMAVPATMETNAIDIGSKPQSSTLIRAFGKAKTPMPDRAALEACTAKKLSPGEETDADMYSIAMMGCLGSTAPGAQPIDVTASVNFGVFPGEPPEAYGLVIEIKRTYLEKTAAPGGKTDIDTFPAKCKLAGR